MKNYRHLKLNLIFLKSLVYRLLSFSIMASGIYFLTNDITKSLQFSLVIEGIKTTIYFFYECAFNKKFKLSSDEGCVVWFTGLPCSGKSSIADEVSERLRESDRRVERLDGDIVRQSICADLGFNKKDINENAKRITFVSKLLSRNGTIVLCSFISPFRAIRYEISEQVTNFIEVYVFADKVTCSQRDVKGMWAKAKAGKIKGFIGFDAPYEPPFKPAVTCITEKETVEESANRVINYLSQRKLI